MKFDPRVIHEMAESLYGAAESAEWSYPLVFGLVGAATGFTFGLPLGYPRIGAVAGAVLFGAVGYWVGQQRSFSLRLQAQLMLVHTQIEENTRPKEASGWIPQPSKDTRAAAARISDALKR